MDTATPAGRAFLQIQAAFAEMERNLIRQRVKEGIVAARARGRKGGRPRIMTVDKLRYAQHLIGELMALNPMPRFSSPSIKAMRSCARRPRRSRSILDVSQRSRASKAMRTPAHQVGFLVSCAYLAQ